MTTTNEIADKIAAEHGLTRTQSKAIVETVLAQITAAAVAGVETSLPGFGKFKVKDTPEREARNPATGTMIKVAAAKKVTFTPAKSLKDALNKLRREASGHTTAAPGPPRHLKSATASSVAASFLLLRRCSLRLSGCFPHLQSGRCA